MSIYYSKFYLNTYLATPYFRSQVPSNYPVRLVLQKLRAFRRLPPNLKLLAENSKKWARDNDQGPDSRGYYDEQGYELDPATGRRLTDAEVDALWQPDPTLERLAVTDIRLPPGGFPDPHTWKPPDEAGGVEAWGRHYDDADDVPSRETLLRDISLRDRQTVAASYGIAVDQLPSTPGSETPSGVRLTNTFCPTGEGGGVDATCSPHGTERSKFEGKKITRSDKAQADANEKGLAAAVGGEWEEDNKFYDVRTKDGKHFIEVKSMLKGSKTVVNAHPDALLRKVNGMVKHPGATFHTVVFDDRDHYEGEQHGDSYSGHGLYYKRGNGRYALSKMHKVSSNAELKRLIRTPDDQLPAAARGSLPSGKKEISALRLAAEGASASRKAKDSKRKEYLKSIGRSAYRSVEEVTNANLDQARDDHGRWKREVAQAIIGKLEAVKDQKTAQEAIDHLHSIKPLSNPGLDQDDAADHQQTQRWFGSTRDRLTHELSEIVEYGGSPDRLRLPIKRLRRISTPGEEP